MFRHKKTTKKAVAGFLGAVTLALLSSTAFAGSAPVGIIPIGDRTQSKRGYIEGGYVGDRSIEMPAKLIEASRSLQEKMWDDFDKGNFAPRAYLASTAKLTGYAIRELAQDAGYLCFLQYVYLPALQDYVTEELLSE